MPPIINGYFIEHTGTFSDITKECGVELYSISPSFTPVQYICSDCYIGTASVISDSEPSINYVFAETIKLNDNIRYGIGKNGYYATGNNELILINSTDTERTYAYYFDLKKMDLSFVNNCVENNQFVVPFSEKSSTIEYFINKVTLYHSLSLIESTGSSTLMDIRGFINNALTTAKDTIIPTKRIRPVSMGNNNIRLTINGITMECASRYMSFPSYTDSSQKYFDYQNGLLCRDLENGDDTNMYFIPDDGMLSDNYVDLLNGDISSITFSGSNNCWKVCAWGYVINKTNTITFATINPTHIIDTSNYVSLTSDMTNVLQPALNNIFSTKNVPNLMIYTGNNPSNFIIENAYIYIQASFNNDFSNDFNL